MQLRHEIELARYLEKQKAARRTASVSDFGRGSPAGLLSKLTVMLHATIPLGGPRAPNIQS
jgi:hypothetical protein